MREQNLENMCIQSHLTRKIASDFPTWAYRIAQLSNGRFTLLQESAVTFDPNDDDKFMLISGRKE
jgi:hypothetical protein